MNYSKLVCALTGLIATGGLSQAALSVVPGDIVLGFSQITPSGTGVTSNTYILNLGAGSTYREYAGGRFTVANINTDLTNAFGAGWASDPTIRIGIVGVVGASDATVNGDPARTTYLSRGYEAGTPGSSTGFTMSSAQAGNASTSISTFRLAMNGIAENGAVNGGAIVPSSTNNDFGDFLPPTSATYFGNSNTFMNVANAGAPVTGLDVHRTLFTTTGADLTAVQTPGDAVVRQSQYIGSFELLNNGEVSFVPEPTTGVLAALCGMLGILRRRRS